MRKLSLLPFVQNDLLRRILDLLCEEPTAAYVAGGYVRDWLLGRESKDVDLTVAAPAIALARRIADCTGGAFYVLDDEMDAARIIYKPPDPLEVDFSGLRGPDIQADLRERDFSVNAMAVDLRDCYDESPEVLDPCGGRDDLAAQTLRAASEHAFQRDPVRLLRAARFGVSMGLRIEPATESWMRRDAALITLPSAERVRQELVLIFAATGVAGQVRRLDDFGLLSPILPEVTALKGVAQSEPHVNDVYEHSLATVGEVERLTAANGAQLSALEREYLGLFSAALDAHLATITSEKRSRRTMLKFAALLHDVGKPMVRSVEPGGRIRFFEHERNGTGIAAEVLTRLRFSAQEAHRAGVIVGNHMRPGLLAKHHSATRRAVYGFFRDCGDAGLDVLLLSLADHLATRGPHLLLEHYRDHLEVVRVMFEAFFHQPGEVISPPPLVTGRDVMELLGIPPGPRVGELLEAVREAQAEGHVRTPDDAREFLRNYRGPETAWNKHGEH